MAEWIFGLYNLAVALVFGWDKRQARRGGRRTPEATLWKLAVALGGPGAVAGMLLFRHKTKKPLFLLGLPALAAGQVWLLLWGRSRGYW